MPDTVNHSHLIEPIVKRGINMRTDLKLNTCFLQRVGI